MKREEFVVVGWTDPEGSRPHLGALLLGYSDLTEGWFLFMSAATAELQRLWRRVQPLATDKMPLDPGRRAAPASARPEC